MISLFLGQREFVKKVAALGGGGRRDLTGLGDGSAGFSGA
jgi:hypothetical protein